MAGNTGKSMETGKSDMPNAEPEESWTGKSGAGETAAGEREYSIREVARMFSVEPSTLRYYEDAGLLTDVGRTPSGQRIYRQCHVNRLGSICCFKHAGMSIADLRRFFIYEGDEAAHIDDMVTLLEERSAAIDEQRRALEEAHEHVLRKLHFYGDIREALRHGGPRPDWDDYRDRIFAD